MRELSHLYLKAFVFPHSNTCSTSPWRARWARLRRTPWRGSRGRGRSGGWRGRWRWAGDWRGRGACCASCNEGVGVGVSSVSWHCGSLYVIAGVNSRPRIKVKYRAVVPLVSRLVNLIVPACGRKRRISGDHGTLRPASLIEFVNDFANLKLIACRKRHVWPVIAFGVRDRVRGVTVNPAEVNR
jgi:hypothetical protein